VQAPEVPYDEDAPDAWLLQQDLQAWARRGAERVALTELWLGGKGGDGGSDSAGDAADAAGGRRE